MTNEEMAQELLKAFEDFNEASEEFEKTFDESMKLFMDECRLHAAEKLITYSHKATCATFITRWYWIRKAKKCCCVLKEVIDMSKELGYVQGMVLKGE